MPSWKALWRLLVMMVGVNLTYRFDIFIWTLAEMAVPLVSLGVWYAVARQGVLPLSPQETITYFIFIMFVRSAVNSWVGFFLSREILTGDIVKFLVRPLSVFWEHIADNVTVKVLRLGVPALLLLAVVALRPTWFSPSIYEPAHVLLFLGSLLLAILLSFTFDTIFALLAFWLEDPQEIIRFQYILWEIAGGVLIPYAVMPSLLFFTLQWLPWRFMVSVPVELLVGQIPVAAAPTFLAGQAIWLLVSLAAVALLWRRGLKRYAVPGQ